MSLNARTYISGIAYIVVAATLLATTAASQQEPQTSATAPSDTVFNEIRLTGKGVTAVDTTGFTWHYDFDNDQFVRGAKSSESSGEDAQFDELLDIPSVEQRCTERIEIVPSTRSVQVGYDEYVEGSINALGRVTVRGWVKGDVQSLRKRVVITETGQVDGDVKAPSIVIKEGGQVLGRVIETGDLFNFEDIGVVFSPNGIIVVASFIGFLLLSAFLLISLMPKQMNEVRSCILSNKARTYWLGFTFILLIPVIITLLIITILGIVLVPFLPIAYLAAIVIGIISFSASIGSRISRIISGNEGAMMVQSIIGILLFMGLWMVVAVLLGSADDEANGFGIALLVISIVISTYPTCTGVGGCLLTRFGFRKYVSWKERRIKVEVTAEGPAPPPIPNVHDQNDTDQGTEPGK